MTERPERIPLNDYKVFRKITTRWMDNDTYGHLNNVVHYSMFDTAVTGWLTENKVMQCHEGDPIGLVVETGCRYFAEMSFPDVITTAIRVAKIGNSSVRYDIGLFRNEETAPSAEGFFVHVYIDPIKRRPAPLCPNLKSALQAIAI